MATLTFNDIFNYDPKVSLDGISVGNMIDTDGYIKKAPHNLLLYSQEFDNIQWENLSNNIVVESAPSILSPDGTYTTTKISANGSFTSLFSTFGLRQITRGLIQEYGSFSLFVKPDPDSDLTIYPTLFQLNSGDYNIFDLENYDVYRNSGAGRIVELENGWYEITYIDNFNNDIPVMLTMSTVMNTTPAFNSSGGTGSLYIWGASYKYGYYYGANSVPRGVGTASNPDMTISIANNNFIEYVSSSFTSRSTDYLYTKPDSYVKTTDSYVFLPRRLHTNIDASSSNSAVTQGILYETHTKTARGSGIRIGYDMTYFFENGLTDPVFDETSKPFHSYREYNNTTGDSSTYGSVAFLPSSKNYVASIFYRKPIGIADEQILNRYIIFDNVSVTGGLAALDVLTDTWVTKQSSVINTYIENYENGWKRAVVVHDTTASGTDQYYLNITTSTSSPSSGSVAGRGPDVALFALIEEIPYPADAFPYTKANSGSPFIRQGESIRMIANTASVVTSATVRVSGYFYYSDRDNANDVGIFEWYRDANNYIATTVDTSSGTGGFVFHINDNGTTYSYTASNTNLIVEETDGKIYFDIAQAVSSNSIIGYIDGQKDGETPITANADNIELILNSDVYLGAVNSLDANYAGVIQTFKVWNYQITDSTIP